MRSETFTLHGVKSEICLQDAPRCLMVQPVDLRDGNAAATAALIAAETAEPFAYVACRVENWNRELSPWPAPAVFGTEDFGDGAAETLDLLEKELLPFVRSRYEIAAEVPVILGGYSLAGLFALWCAANSGAFAAVAAVSPSVWFRGWIDYAAAHRARADFVYLSLGDREEKTRNREMAAVGQRIREQAALLERGGVRHLLEWNPGGHFREPERRCARGFARCVRGIGPEDAHQEQTAGSAPADD